MGVHCSSCRYLGRVLNRTLKLSKEGMGSTSVTQTQKRKVLSDFPQQHSNYIMPVLCLPSLSLSLWLLAFPDSYGRSRSRPADPFQRALPPARPAHPEPPDQHHLLCLRHLHPAASPLWSQVGQRQEMEYARKFIDAITTCSATSLL